MKFGNKGQDLGGAFGLCVKLLLTEEIHLG